MSSLYLQKKWTYEQRSLLGMEELGIYILYPKTLEIVLTFKNGKFFY